MLISEGDANIAAMVLEESCVVELSKIGGKGYPVVLSS